MLQLMKRAEEETSDMNSNSSLQQRLAAAPIIGEYRRTLAAFSGDSHSDVPPQPRYAVEFISARLLSEAIYISIAFTCMESYSGT